MGSSKTKAVLLFTLALAFGVLLFGGSGKPHTEWRGSDDQTT